MLSTLSWVIICFVLLIIKYAILSPIEDMRLYRMYEARDNVALAALEGKISQDAKEYRFVIDSINYEIYYMKNNYDFSIVFKNLFFRPENVKQYFESMYQLIEQYEILQKSHNISFNYFKRSLNYRLSFFIHLVVRPFYFVLCISLAILTAVEQITKLGDNIVNGLERRKTVVNTISSEYVEYRNEQLKKA